MTLEMSTAAGVKLYRFFQWLRALLGCELGTLWKMFMVRDPATGMTEWERTMYLEQVQDKREQELIEKSELAYSDDETRRIMIKKHDQEQQEKSHEEAVQKQKDDYAKLGDKEKARVDEQQTQLEKDTQAKQNRAASIRAKQRKAVSVEKPADYSAGQKATASTASGAASPVLAQAKPQAAPTDPYPSDVLERNRE